MRCGHSCFQTSCQTSQAPFARAPDPLQVAAQCHAHAWCLGRGHREHEFVPSPHSPGREGHRTGLEAQAAPGSKSLLSTLITQAQVSELAKPRLPHL